MARNPSAIDMFITGKNILEHKNRQNFGEGKLNFNTVVKYCMSTTVVF